MCEIKTESKDIQNNLSDQQVLNRYNFLPGVTDIFEPKDMFTDDGDSEYKHNVK